MANLADTLHGILEYHSTLLTRVEREALGQVITCQKLVDGGRMLQPPYIVGDTVYTIVLGEIVQDRVIAIGYHSDCGWITRTEKCGQFGDWHARKLYGSHDEAEIALGGIAHAQE